MAEHYNTSIDYSLAYLKQWRRLWLLRLWMKATRIFRRKSSTADSSVADRLTQSAVPYVLVDGTRIADDWADLTDGSLQAVIDLDATGMSHWADVWTGTLPSGLAYTEADCDGFTNGGMGSALCGTTQSINSSWTANQVPTCDTRLRLFCFEQ